MSFCRHFADKLPNTGWEKTGLQIQNASFLLYRKVRPQIEWDRADPMFSNPIFRSIFTKKRRRCPIKTSAAGEKKMTNGEAWVALLGVTATVVAAGYQKSVGQREGYQIGYEEGYS